MWSGNTNSKYIQDQLTDCQKRHFMKVAQDQVNNIQSTYSKANNLPSQSDPELASKSTLTENEVRTLLHFLMPLFVEDFL